MVSVEAGNRQRFGPFHDVFLEGACQEQVFRTTSLPLVESLLQCGQNGLLLAYGASGSGKTYTVSGGGKTPGMLPMILSFLFHHLEGDAELEKVSMPLSPFVNSILPVEYRTHSVPCSVDSAKRGRSLDKVPPNASRS